MRLERYILIAAAAAVVGPANAQDIEDDVVETLDLTITLMPEGAALPEAVTRVIELPDTVADAARENARDGLDQADAARDRRDDGLETAEAASERGRDRAQQAREDLGRGPPDWDSSEPPGPPDVPGDGPGGPPVDPPGPGGPPATPGPP